MTFAKGRIENATAREGQAVLDAYFKAAPALRQFREFCIGFNPKLPASGPGGRLPYYGYGAGILRVALGDNWESGGSSSSSLEAWFYLTDATVAAGDTVIVRGGTLVLK